MEVALVKRAKNPKPEIEYFKLSDIKMLVSNSSLLLVQVGIMEVDDITGKSNAELLEIFKVQFIASCKTELHDDLIVAFYSGEYGCLHAYVVGGLPDNYYQEGDTFKLIDYKSYSEICEITGETKLSLGEYINALTHSNVGQNALINYKGQFLNYDKQKALWEEIDSKTALIN